MKIAVMQPYFFPYIGYFQLVNAVDHFVFYDDVNFIKGGWINRNRILINNRAQYITVPCIKLSSNKLIEEIEVNKELPEYWKIIKTINQVYKKAPYFDQVFPLVEKNLNSELSKLSEIAIHSIKLVSDYLKLDTRLYVSSIDFGLTKGMDKVDRLIEICKKLEGDTYINPSGGKELYEKAYFKEKGVKLQFIESEKIKYPQFSNYFVPWLSIIDVLMFNSVEEIHRMLDQYDLV